MKDILNDLAPKLSSDPWNSGHVVETTSALLLFEASVVGKNHGMSLQFHILRGVIANDPEIGVSNFN